MKRPKRLTNSYVERIDRPGFYGDGRGGHGLQLRVHRTTAGHISKSWRQCISFQGRMTSYGLGAWPIISLDEARVAALGNRIAIARGNDPRKRARAPQAAPVTPTAAPVAPATLTFREAGERVIELRRHSWKSPTTAMKWEKDIGDFPFSDIPLSLVNKTDILSYLSPLWSSRHAYARRKLGVLQAVFKWAVPDHIGVNPTVSVRSELPPVRNGVKHHASLPHAEVGAALKAVDEYSSLPRPRREAGLLIRFIALTATRTAEAAGATWDEIDRDNRVWIIPGTRTKTGREHRVPLSTGARIVLSEAKALHGDAGVVYPSRKGGPIKAGSTGAMLKASGVDPDDGTVHGLRASFRSWCADTGVPYGVSEAALGHNEKNHVVRAYQRSDLLEARRKVMEKWATYLA